MRKIQLNLLILVLVFSTAFPAAIAQTNTSRLKTSKGTLATRGVNTITAAQLKNYLSFIASDEMEGRDTPSRGLDTTAKFIAMNLERWGFKPAGDDGTFFQKIALRREVLDMSRTTAEIDGQKFAFGDDFVANAVSASLSGRLVFAGNGWVLKSKNLNSYEGIDVKDKIIVVVGVGFPRGTARADLAGVMGVDWSSPAVYAQQHGARGVISIADAGTMLNWETLRQR